MQSGDSFEFALRLCGQRSIWEECSRYVTDREQGILQLPAKVPNPVALPCPTLTCPALPYLALPCFA